MMKLVLGQIENQLWYLSILTIDKESAWMFKQVLENQSGL